MPESCRLRFTDRKSTWKSYLCRWARSELDLFQNNSIRKTVLTPDWSLQNHRSLNYAYQGIAQILGFDPRKCHYSFDFVLPNQSCLYSPKPFALNALTEGRAFLRVDRNGSHAVTLVITFHLLELGFAPWLDAAVDDNRQPIRHIRCRCFVDHNRHRSRRRSCGVDPLVSHRRESNGWDSFYQAATPMLISPAPSSTRRPRR